MLNIPVKDCCGCTACYCSCPTSAIQMQPDAEGFLYPQIDSARCCKCRRCEKVCPVLNPPALSQKYEDCIIAQSKTEEVLDSCTSGGFVDTLCRYVLEKCNGYVAGVAYDESFMPTHKIVDSYEAAKAFRNSKYAQSVLGNVFSDVQKLLSCGEVVMFIGTPCQVAGLKSFLGKDYSNLVSVDLVCRSIPSPKFWREYLNWQEMRHKAPIKEVTCRKKTYGYHSGTLELQFETGKRYTGSNRVDYFMKCFHGDICSRRSCYGCHFKTKHRCSDFTVFDCWRPSLATEPAVEDNDRGYSNVLVHTAKGKDILNALADISLYQSDPDRMLSVMGSMIAKSIEMNDKRHRFYADLDQYGFEETVKRYKKVTFKDRLIEAAKPVRFMAQKARRHAVRRQKNERNHGTD